MILLDYKLFYQKHISHISLFLKENTFIYNITIVKIVARHKTNSTRFDHNKDSLFFRSRQKDCPQVIDLTESHPRKILYDIKIAMMWVVFIQKFNFLIMDILL